MEQDVDAAGPRGVDVSGAIPFGRTASGTFGDRVAEAVDRKRSQLVIGLDPRPELLPVELRAGAHVSRAAAADACLRFCVGLIDAVASYVVGAKLQLAFFEAFGADGMRSFKEASAYARHAGLLVVADGERADVGSTGRACADASLEGRQGSAPTLAASTASAQPGR